jgi:hypothetical protein
VPSQEGLAREAEDGPEWEVRNKIPKKIRPVFVRIRDVASVHKWYAHDQFKPENQVKEVSAQGSKEVDDSKLHQAVKKYLDVESIEWSKDCPKNMKEARIFYQIGSSGNFPYT